ncbi:MAG: FKBP-type peptidyl-prolyl cis-trans isomerase [Candidatus Caldarchaeum sp.]|nr:peptidylprolyl isomerase [Candidatus Caldarchaeum sp.]MDW8063865.1 FKBP-type peptidyl-prolyl cis-trans isomerase [Candidatus Caldarchaeum sp.]
MTEETSSAEQALTVQPNSYVLVDYTIRVKETGELVDTTVEEEAVKAGVRDASKTYEPRLVIVGKGLLLKAVEDELVGMKPAEKKSFEIAPEKAFGTRDPANVRTIPLRKFKDADAPLRVGAVVNVEGRQGVVRAIGSGRVQVDFNHYLAGKTLLCDVEVKSILTDDLEKIKNLIHLRIPDVPVEKFEITLTPPEARIKIPEDAFLIPGLQLAKRALAKEIKEAAKGVEKTVFVEEYSTA